MLILGSNMALAKTENSKFIEEILVVGTVEQINSTEVTSDFTFIESVMPAVSFTAGGYGGFAGFTERGAQNIHTTIFRNGVPVNDAGSGWYDFAHDIVTGLEEIKIVSGPNSVLYGSGNLGGTVFINDKVSNQTFSRIGDDHKLVNVSVFDSLSFTYFDVSNGSVRNDNTEVDNYENSTVKFVKDIFGFKVAASQVDYDYDYDDCFTSDFASSNDCLQSGEKTDLSVRNENVTVGYSSNKSEYFTEGVSTWDSDAERYYFDAREKFLIGTPAAELIVGITYNKEEYAGLDQDDISGYASINFENRFQVGARLSDDAAVYRVGWESDGFFTNLSTSYRNPTLYEVVGDAFVNANPALEPEEGFGVEIGYQSVSFFKYSFDENIDYDFGLNQFVNTGKYDTKGIRFQDAIAVPYGSVNVFLGYTDSDQPRVPEYKGRISYFGSFNNFNAEFIYTAMFDRGVDVLGTELQDIKSFDFVLNKSLSERYSLSLTVQDVFDNVVEVLPGYNAGGRSFFLTLQYK